MTTPALAIEYRAADLLALARTLYGEARSEGEDGMAAVAWVVRNRLAKPGWWSKQRGDGIPDNTVEAVCLDPAQFSCWWDAQGPKIRKMTLEQCGAAGKVAYNVLAGWVPDLTYGATHYHTIGRPEGVKQWPPTWAAGLQHTVTIRRHIFYKG